MNVNDVDHFNTLDKVNAICVICRDCQLKWRVHVHKLYWYNNG